MIDKKGGGLCEMASLKAFLFQHADGFLADAPVLRCKIQGVVSMGAEAAQELGLSGNSLRLGGVASLNALASCDSRSNIDLPRAPVFS